MNGLLKTYHIFFRIGMILFLMNICSLQEVCSQNFEGQDIPKAMQRRMRIRQQKDSVSVQPPRNASEDNVDMEEKITLPDSIVSNEAMDASLTFDSTLVHTESLTIPTKQLVPDPAKATWLAAIFPGGGQIYNRKYWKLPIVYGGFVGCAYALTWNGQMYSDYSQAYLDIMDDNPQTDSFLNLLPPGYNVDANLEYLKKVIKRKKDTYRRYRDLSIFCFIGVYLISIVDAYVDAELASFDINDDLSLKMEPTAIPNNQYDIKQGNAYGLQCSIRF